MFTATTSEDFASTFQHQHDPSTGPKVQILVIPSSLPAEVVLPHALKIENIHMTIGSVGWCICEGGIKNADPSSLCEQQLKIVVNECKERFETIACKKSLLGLGIGEHGEASALQKPNNVEVIHLATQNPTQQQQIIDSLLQSSSSASDSTKKATLILYLSNQIPEMDLQNSLQNSNLSGDRFLNLLLPTLTPSHGISKRDFCEGLRSGTLGAFPFAIIQPKMHRRILLTPSLSSSSLSVPLTGKMSQDENVEKLYRHAITLKQVLMEVLQKGGLLGKYGA